VVQSPLTDTTAADLTSSTTVNHKILQIKMFLKISENVFVSELGGLLLAIGSRQKGWLSDIKSKDYENTKSEGEDRRG